MHAQVQEDARQKHNVQTHLSSAYLHRKTMEKTHIGTQNMVWVNDPLLFIKKEERKKINTTTVTVISQ